MEKPLVTIVSPSYNHSKFVIESLDSIRKQTYSNIQHIIIDDYSTDDSVIKIKEWINNNNYECTFIQHKKNMGLSYTLNEGIMLSNGTFWTALATDDFISINRTEIFVNYLLDHLEANMVTSDCTLIDEDSKPTSKDGSYSLLKYCLNNLPSFSIEKDFGTYKSILQYNYMPVSIMMRKNIFDKVGMFNTKYIMEDWDMWLRISSISRIHYIDDTLMFYRFHQTNTSKQNLSYKMQKAFLHTFLCQYKYCKKKGYIREFKKKYSNMFFFSPFKKFYLSFLFMFLSPPHLYITVFLEKTKKLLIKLFYKIVSQ